MNAEIGVQTFVVAMDTNEVESGGFIGKNRKLEKRVPRAERQEGRRELEKDMELPCQPLCQYAESMPFCLLHGYRLQPYSTIFPQPKLCPRSIWLGVL